MELRQIEYLVTVVDEGGFSAAARRLGVAQPSVSEQIRKLEEELRQPLLDRLPRRVVPTPAGQELVEHARQILSRVRQAASRATDAAGLVCGPLTVAAIPTIAPFLLPQLIQAYEKAYPDVKLKVVEDTTPRLIELIERGDVDIALASTAESQGSVHVEHVCDEPLHLMTSTKHRLANRSRIQGKDLTEERFVALHELHCLADQSMKFCARQGVYPPIIMQGSNLFTLAAMVASNMGVSMVPAMMMQAPLPRDVVFHDFKGDKPVRPLTLLWSLLRYRTLASREFANMAIRAMKKK
jgi:LysR family hydrogen peroxide-inducible transcriptional activator